MIRKILTTILIFTCSYLWAAENDLYDFSWLDKDKEIYVLQNRKFRKKETFHITAGYGMTTSGAFVDANAIQGRASYFFTEELGIEFLYSKNSGKENDTAKSVRNTGSGSGARPFRRIVDSYYGAMLTWAPFYSKINTFNKIIYLDIIFGLGAGKIEETNNRPEFELQGDTVETNTENHNALLWSFGTRFYLTERWSVQYNINGTHYKAKKAIPNTTTDAWYQNVDMALSLGFNF